MNPIPEKTSKLSRALAGTVTATTAMTAFSYALSKTTHKQFREPELLSYLLHQQPLVKVTRDYRWADKTSGFAAHYLAGLGFAAGYEWGWKPFVKLPTLLKGAAYGLVAGAAGVVVWEGVIQLRKDPPKLQKSQYYPHLIAAHVIFGAAMALTSKVMSKS